MGRNFYRCVLNFMAIDCLLSNQRAFHWTSLSQMSFRLFISLRIEMQMKYVNSLLVISSFFFIIKTSIFLSLLRAFKNLLKLKLLIRCLQLLLLFSKIIKLPCGNNMKIIARRAAHIFIR